MASKLLETINTDLKASMKARDDKLRVSTLRLITAAVKDRDIAARAEDRCSGISDDEILAILTKMVKQREESSKVYEEAGRLELAEQEQQEIAVIQDYLPQQLSEDEIEKAVNAVIDDIGAEGLKDMGKCMGALKERYQGAMDFSVANQKVKSRLVG
ncbi:MAG: GatB/YqeY domain-containing protein [Pseudomonadota bacterium]